MLTHKHPINKRLQVIYMLLVCGILGITTVLLQSLHVAQKGNDTAPGVQVDAFNGVPVYYNGAIDHVIAKHVTKSGYNLGLKWQCVEFVKRYYYIHFNHEMPNASGNAKDFFDKSLPDASYNYDRALVQYANPSLKMPAVDDILVFDGHLGNKYGHIAIITAVTENDIEIIQQNPGPTEPSRKRIGLKKNGDRYVVEDKHVLGWMRIE